MASEKVRFRLGLFVVSGIVLGVAGFLAIGASQLLRKTIPMHFYFEDSVQGLSEGSEVTYRGVLVGRVAKIEMQSVEPSLLADTDEREPLVIHVEAEVYPDVFPPDPQTELRANSLEDWKSSTRNAARRGLRSKLSYKGITGQMYLGLDVYDVKEYPEPPLPVVPQEPYIPNAKDPTLSDIQRGLGHTIDQLQSIDWIGLAKKLNETLNTINTEAQGLNAAAVAKEAQATLKQIRQTLSAPELQRSVSRLDTITADLVTSTREVRELVSGDELDTALGDLVASARQLRETTTMLNDRLPGAIDGFNATVGNVDAAVTGAKLPETMDTMRTAMSDVGTAARGASALREDLRRAVRDIGDAAHFLARLARALEEDPTSLISGKRRRGEAQR